MKQRGQISDVKVYAFDYIGEAVADLITGKITAVMKVYPVAPWLTRRTSGLRIVAQIPKEPQPLGIGFNNNKLSLVAATDATSEEIKRDGTYARLAREWSIY